MYVHRDERNKKKIQNHTQQPGELIANTSNAVGRKVEYLMVAVGKAGYLPKLILKGSLIYTQNIELRKHLKKT